MNDNKCMYCDTIIPDDRQMCPICEAELPTVGHKIKYLRQQSGMTQERLSKKLYVCEDSIFRMEKNSASPNANIIVAICNLFKVSADWLLGIAPERK